MQRFETIVREILRTALERIPADEVARRSFLNLLCAVTDPDRLERIRQMANGIQDVPLRDRCLRAARLEAS
jgi:hypothetical protein